MIEYLLSTFNKPDTDPHKANLSPQELPSYWYGGSVPLTGEQGHLMDFIFPE